jgi:hypothetical protein
MPFDGGSSSHADIEGHLYKLKRRNGGKTIAPAEAIAEAKEVFKDSLMDLIAKDRLAREQGREPEWQ